jgi:hypothetical protein
MKWFDDVSNFPKRFCDKLDLSLPFHRIPKLFVLAVCLSYDVYVYKKLSERPN